MRELIVAERDDAEYLQADPADNQTVGRHKRVRSWRGDNASRVAAAESRRAAVLEDAAVFSTEPTVARTAAGEVLGVYEQADVGSYADLRGLLLTVVPYAGIRGGGMLTRCKTFGGRPRTVLNRMDWCSSFQLTIERPEVHEALVPVAEEATALLTRWRPDIAEEQRELVGRIRPEYRLGDSLFTSGIINYTSALSYHRDGGNFPGSWNAMLTLREHTTGGSLVVPSLDWAFACGDATWSVFNAQARTHGVTPIERVRRDGYRLSIVFYALRALCNCGPRADEVTRAQRIRTEREERRAGLRD